jgi:hypothetical protein
MTALDTQNLLLFFVQNDPPIMISSLLLPFCQKNPAIMTANHAKLILTLQLIVVFIQGALIAQDNFYGTLSNSEGVRASTNNFNESKISLHFRKDCGIFCEGEWEQIIKRDGIAIIHANNRNNSQLLVFGLIMAFSHNKLIELIGLLGLIRFVGHIGHSCLVDIFDAIGFVRQTSLVGLIGNISFIGLINFGLITINGFVGLVGLIGFIGHIGLIGHSGLFGFGLVNHDGYVGIFSLVGLDFIGLNCLVAQISLINLLAL